MLSDRHAFMCMNQETIMCTVITGTKKKKIIIISFICLSSYEIENFVIFSIEQANRSDGFMKKLFHLN